jgi:pimeloyl-ACP methyl ester carboxylesterase
MTTYHHANVRGQKLFYREAGQGNSPTIVLLHGFPSSSHMFRDLIPQLANKFHVIAPDYVGFGYSDAPSVQEFEYTFDNLASYVEDLLFKDLGLKKFSIYVQDYGAPVGYRIASKHPDAIQSIVVQNGNAYEEGIGHAFDPMKPFWANRNPDTEKPVRSTHTVSPTLIELAPIPTRWINGSWTVQAMRKFSSTFSTTISRMSLFTTVGTSTSGTDNQGC